MTFRAQKFKNLGLVSELRFGAEHACFEIFQVSS